MGSRVPAAWLWPGLGALVAVLAMCRARQGLHVWEAKETPQSLNVLPRAVNPKITPPAVPGVWLSPIIQAGEIHPHHGCPHC